MVNKNIYRNFYKSSFRSLIIDDDMVPSPEQKLKPFAKKFTVVFNLNIPVIHLSLCLCFSKSKQFFRTKSSGSTNNFSIKSCFRTRFCINSSLQWVFLQMDIQPLLCSHRRRFDKIVLSHSSPCLVRFQKNSTITQF